MSDIKITPAMRAWARRLLNPTMCQLKRSSPHAWRVYTYGMGSERRPTYIMAKQLEDAGLIEWHGETLHPMGPQYAKLTEFGEMVARGLLPKSEVSK